MDAQLGTIGMDTIKIELRFVSPILGTMSPNPDIQRDYISSKAPSEQRRQAEVDAISQEVQDSIDIEEEVEKTKTIFPRMENGQPFLWDYQLKGFFKDACGLLRYSTSTKSKKLTAYKKRIDGCLFIVPERVALVLPPAGIIDECQRPLRASTPKGERVALANSEQAPRNTTMEFEVCLTDSGLKPLVHEWLDYGRLHGIGQWRNSGKGKFVYSAYGADGKYLFGTAPDHR